MTKLVNDSTYCAAAVQSPQMITTDFPTLTPLKLRCATRMCGVLGGGHQRDQRGACRRHLK